MKATRATLSDQDVDAMLVVPDPQQSGVIGVDSLNYRSVNISSSTWRHLQHSVREVRGM